MINDMNSRPERPRCLGVRRFVVGSVLVFSYATAEQVDHTISPYIIASSGGMASSATHSIRATLGEPGTGTVSSTKHSIKAGFWMVVMVPICLSDGDSNGDGDIDLNDFQAFQECVGGTGDPPAGPQCDCFDFDLDTDVDLVDIGIFQRVFTGS